MQLSIITINRNNAAGLEKTLKSVASQTCKDFEHVIIDGASTDNSVEVIRQYVENTNNQPSGILSGVEAPITHHQIKWISEPDKGIYNAMNKGIRMASGDYTQILNSGDCLATDATIEQMLGELKKNEYPDFLYGNMIKVWPDGRKYKGGVGKTRKFTFFDFYSGMLDHDGAFVRKDLYDRFGFYDESLKICSDWKWMLNVVPLGGVQPVYANVDSILFDMSGVSESEGRNKGIIASEKRIVLEKTLNPSILADYDNYGGDISMMKRMRRHPWAFKIVSVLERILFKLEKRELHKKCFYKQ